MSEHDLVLKEQRLSFRVHFPVHHWTGSGLRSPTYPIRELKVGRDGMVIDLKSVGDTLSIFISHKLCIDSMVDF